MIDLMLCAVLLVLVTCWAAYIHSGRECHATCNRRNANPVAYRERVIGRKLTAEEAAIESLIFCECR